MGLRQKKMVEEEMEMRTAQEIANDIKSMDTWDNELLKELCEAADMMEEWDQADGETFESVVFSAAKKLGVEIL